MCYAHVPNSVLYVPDGGEMKKTTFILMQRCFFVQRKDAETQSSAQRRFLKFNAKAQRRKVQRRDVFYSPKMQRRRDTWSYMTLRQPLCLCVEF